MTEQQDRTSPPTPKRTTSYDDKHSMRMCLEPTVATVFHDHTRRDLPTRMKLTSTKERNIRRVAYFFSSSDAQRLGPAIEEDIAQSDHAALTEQARARIIVGRQVTQYNTFADIACIIRPNPVFTRSRSQQQALSRTHKMSVPR